MNISKKKRCLIWGVVVLLISACSVFAYFTFNLHIPHSLHIQKMVYINYYEGNHFICSGSSKLYEIEICGYAYHDDMNRTTVYNFKFEVDNVSYTASIEYPGTPKRQYYGFPRLSKGEKYILLTATDIMKPNNTVKLNSGYNLFFLQNIDGVEYAYPCIFDSSMVSLSVVGQNIPFKYVYESQIYDTWNDADVYDMLKNQQTFPEFEYKLLADDLRNNFRLILYKGDR